MKILVIKQTSLGDVLHATAVLRSIRKTYPEARLDFLTSTTAADILRYNPGIDQLLLFDRYREKRAKKGGLNHSKAFGQNQAFWQLG